MQKKEVRNPHDHNRLICTVDEKNRAAKFFAKGWVTRIEFKEDGTVDILHYQKDKPK